MRHLLVGSLFAFGLLVAAARPVDACQGPAVVFADIALDVDIIALVEVTGRTDSDGAHEYRLAVERVLKGSIGPVWLIEAAGTSDCGMPRLGIGQRYVLEYWKPGRLVDSPIPRPWFFAWEVAANERVTPFWPQEPSPTTLDALLAAFARVLPETDVATVEPPASTPAVAPPALAIFAAALVATAISWTRRKRASAG